MKCGCLKTAFDKPFKPFTCSYCGNAFLQVKGDIFILNPLTMNLEPLKCCANAGIIKEPSPFKCEVCGVKWAFSDCGFYTWDTENFCSSIPT